MELVLDDLGGIAKNLDANTRPLSLAVFQTLERIRRDVLLRHAIDHFGIACRNILVRNQDSPVLIDFQNSAKRHRGQFWLAMPYFIRRKVTRKFQRVYRDIQMPDFTACSGIEEHAPAVSASARLRTEGGTADARLPHQSVSRDKDTIHDDHSFRYQPLLPEPKAKPRPHIFERRTHRLLAHHVSRRDQAASLLDQWRLQAPGLERLFGDQKRYVFPQLELAIEGRTFIPKVYRLRS
jgi:hypothetical protein